VAGGAYLSGSSDRGAGSIAAGPSESRSLLEQSLHEQYRLAGGLGMDGLMLSMTPEPERLGTATPAPAGAAAPAAKTDGNEDGKQSPAERAAEEQRDTPNL
jgi:hypothetical protein